MRIRRLLASALLVLALPGAGGCTQRAETSAEDFAYQLRNRITVDAVVGHMRRLDEIARANGGNRRTGTAGYSASVDYVATTLRSNGFDVQTPEFDVEVFEVAKESLTIGGVDIPVRAVDYSGVTPPSGVTGTVVVASAETPDCAPAGVDPTAVRGAVLVVDSGGCPLADTAAAAARLGARGVVLVGGTNVGGGGASLRRQDNVALPVLVVDEEDGRRMTTLTGIATLVLEGRIAQLRGRNVTAQTRTGSTSDVVMVGAHIDSARFGSGINDNGSGVAVALETALAVGDSPGLVNAVRFAFWGAEQEGAGAADYVHGLDSDALKDIALYLSIDMVGSPNPGYFTLDGDGSAQAGGAAVAVPDGSAAIERALTGQLARSGVTPEDLAFDGTGDYGAFARTGVPVGQLFTGSEGRKTAQQAGKWGGEAGEAFDPNHRSSDDTLSNVSRTALQITVPAIGYIVGHYAQAQDGEYAVPSREDRTRQPLR